MDCQSITVDATPKRSHCNVENQNQPGSYVRGDGADVIACCFVDTDYNEGSFFVGQGTSSERGIHIATYPGRFQNRHFGAIHSSLEN